MSKLVDDSFKAFCKTARNILMITGAGVSADSGISTFRGPGGLWRQYKATELATPSAFKSNPRLVWQFYLWRAYRVLNCQPNPGHVALAQFEQRFLAAAAADTAPPSSSLTGQAASRTFHIVTQNIDGMHQRAGSKNVMEFHGSLMQTLCPDARCAHVDQLDLSACVGHDMEAAAAAFHAMEPDNSSTAAAEARQPTTSSISSRLRSDDAAMLNFEMPRCSKCGCVARPNVVWFGESYRRELLSRVEHELMPRFDLCLVVGTSGMVPTLPEMAIEQVCAREPSGRRIAEFNLEKTFITPFSEWSFLGRSKDTLPAQLDSLFN